MSGPCPARMSIVYNYHFTGSIFNNIQIYRVVTVNVYDICVLFITFVLHLKWLVTFSHSGLILTCTVSELSLLTGDNAAIVVSARATSPSRSARDRICPELLGSHPATGRRLNRAQLSCRCRHLTADKHEAAPGTDTNVKHPDNMERYCNKPHNRQDGPMIEHKCSINGPCPFVLAIIWQKSNPTSSPKQPSFCTKFDSD